MSWVRIGKIILTPLPHRSSRRAISGWKRSIELKALFEDEYSGYLYSRGLNPTVEILRKKLAALDGAEDCLVFNSGAAAIFAAVLANVKAGDHIVSVNRPYTWAQRMFDVILPRFGVTTTYVDGTRIENFEQAILPATSLIYLESPNSWDYQLQDLGAIAELARAEGIVTIIDNSYCTPLYQRRSDWALTSACRPPRNTSAAIATLLAACLRAAGK